MGGLPAMAGRLYATPANPCPVCGGPDRCTQTVGHQGNRLLFCFRVARNHPGIKPGESFNGWTFTRLDKQGFSAVMVEGVNASKTFSPGLVSETSTQAIKQEEGARKREQERVKHLTWVLIGGLVASAQDRHRRGYPTHQSISYFKTAKGFKDRDLLPLDIHYGRPIYPRPLTQERKEALELAAKWHDTTAHLPLVDAKGTPWNLESLYYLPNGESPRFTLKGGKVDGLFIPVPYRCIGFEGRSRVALVEGVATALSLYLALQAIGLERPVLACRTASNIPKVATSIMRAYPFLYIDALPDPDQAGEVVLKACARLLGEEATAKYPISLNQGKCSLDWDDLRQLDAMTMLERVKTLVLELEATPKGLLHSFPGFVIPPTKKGW